VTIFSKNDNSIHTRFLANDQRRSGSLYFAGEVHVTGPATPPIIALTTDALNPAGTDVVLAFFAMVANTGTAGGWYANLNDGWPGRKVVPLSPCRIEVANSDAANAGLLHYRTGFLSR
jgi:hypothetical protein